MNSVKIVYYHTDSKKVTKMKQCYSDLVCMLDLKISKRWWKEDEEKFRKKHKLNSDDNKIMKVLRKLEDLLGFDSYETIRNIKEK